MRTGQTVRFWGWPWPRCHDHRHDVLFCSGDDYLSIMYHVRMEEQTGIRYLIADESKSTEDAARIVVVYALDGDAEVD
jgi:hypothetical protein